MNTLDRIVEILDEKKLSQKDLTDYLGISKGAFTDWKAGRLNSYHKYLNKIAEFLDVSSDYLLGVEGSNKDSLKNVSFAFNDFSNIDMEIAKRTKALPDNKKMAILHLITAMEEENEK